MRELGDIEQEIFILRKVLEERRLTVDEEKEVKQEMANLKRRYTILEKKLKDKKEEE